MSEKLPYCQAISNTSILRIQHELCDTRIKDPDVDTTEFFRREVLAVYRHIYFNNLYKVSSLILRVEFLMAVTLKSVTVLWDVMPCSLLDVCRHFGGAY
jgi:hypothetical protein